MLPNATSSAPRSLRLLLPALLVALLALGLAGWVELRTRPVSVRRPLQEEAGSTWFLQDETPEGSAGPPRYGRPPGSASGVELRPGTAFQVLSEDYELQRFASVAFGLQALQEGTVLELALRESPQGASLLTLRPGEPLRAEAVLRRADRPPERVAQGSLASVAPRPDGTLQLSVALDGVHLQAGVNGQRLLAWDVPGLKRGNIVLRVRAGACRLVTFRAGGKETAQRGSLRDFSIQEALVDPAPTPVGPVLRGVLALAAATALAALLFLRALCRARPPWLRLLLAGQALLAAPALPLALSLLAPVPSLDIVLALAAAAGMALAVRSLQPWLREATASPDAPARPRLRRVTALLAFAVLAGGAAWLCGRQQVTAMAPQLERETQARQLPLPAPFGAEDVALDQGSALTLAGPWRDLDLRATVELEPDAALGVRLRAPAADVARGLLFSLSADPLLPSGLRVEDLMTLETLVQAGAPAPAGRALALELQVRDRGVRAVLDGRELLQAEDATFASGALVLLAERGRLRLRDLSVTPVPAVAAGNPVLRAWLSGLPLVAAVLLYGLLAAWLLQHPLSAVLQVSGCALLPVGAGLLLLERDEPITEELLLAWGAGLAGPLAVHALAHAPGARRAATTTGLLLLAALAGGAAPALAIDRGLVADAVLMNRMTYVDWSGSRLEDERIWLQHPLLRRWNYWLADHRFHDREFPVARSAGVRRVLVLGGSSTWGYRIPPASGMEWPAQLEGLLGRRGPVEVLNGAYVGATSNRLYRLLRDALLPFAPDVVVLCVTFNDSSSRALGDEEAYYAAVSAPGAERSWLGDRAARDALEREKAVLSAIIAAVPGDPRPSLEQWRAAGLDTSPPERLHSTLQDFARLCAQHGMRLVLVKEPLAGDLRIAWKEEFYAAIDAVAAEHGLAVVDPTPALQAAGGAPLFIDRVHPKYGGCTVIASEVDRVLGPLLFEP